MIFFNEIILKAIGPIIPTAISQRSITGLLRTLIIIPMVFFLTNHGQILYGNLNTITL